jgi:hypothetical protein
MRRPIMAGVLLALLVGGLAIASPALSVDAVWPVVLAAAAVLVPGGQVATRVAALLLGAVASWAGYDLHVAALPDIAAAQGIALALAILLVTAIAVASRDRLPLWTGLIGVAALSGLYEAAFRAAPASFVAEGSIALTTLLLTATLGAAASMLANRGADALEPAAAALAGESR